MLGWLRSRLSRSEEGPRPPLEADFRSLDSLQAGLGLQLAAYVYRGEHPDCLARLERLTRAGSTLQLLTGQAAQRPRQAHYAQEDWQDPARLWRLAQVLATASIGQPLGMFGMPYQPCPMWPPDCQILEPFLMDCLQVVPHVYPPRPRNPGLLARHLESMLELAGVDPEQLYAALLSPRPGQVTSHQPWELLSDLPDLGERLGHHQAVVREALAARSAAARATALERLAALGVSCAPFRGELLRLAVGSSKRVAGLAQAWLQAGGLESLEAELATLPAAERGRAEDWLARCGAQQAEPSLPLPELEPEGESVVADSVRAAWDAVIAAQQENRRRYPRWADPEGLKGVLDGSRPWNRPIGLAFQERGVEQAWEQLVSGPELTLKQLAQLLLATGQIVESRGSWTVTHAGGNALNLYHSLRPFELRRLDRVLTSLGCPPGLCGRVMLDQAWMVRLFPWPDGDLWPYFAEHPEQLETALRGSGSADSPWMARPRRQRALEVLGAFPELPVRFLEALWSLALTGPRQDRPLARARLAHQADRAARLREALRAGRAEVRQGAAEWLAELRDPSFEEPVRSALAIEKVEAVRAAQLRALQNLGYDLRRLLDREALYADCRARSEGGPEWFHFEELPRLHWAEDGLPLPPEVARAWVAQTHRQKTPVASPLLCLYCRLLRREDREALGSLVLSRWMHRDTREADSSAIADKGLLALVGACDGRLAPAVEGYLKTHYGNRAAQCKALLQMLGVTEEPLTVGLLLSVAGRFRTRGIQVEAGRVVERLAEDRGWTRAQLADRSVSSLGFGEDGCQFLDYGRRRLSLHLGYDLGLVIRDEEGRTLKSLPQARSGDDPEAVAAARTRVQALKRDLKSLLSRQQTRFYEAACAQRSWTWSDWHDHILCHPILGRLSVRLVWTARRGEEVRHLRPLEDGSLTDVHDQSVTLGPGWELALAHPCHLEDAEVGAWRRHLADYEVPTGLGLFDRGVFRLPPELVARTALSHFEGHTLEAFRLRSRALSLGYVRGQTEDGGWFFSYRKSFPELALETVIEFSGNSLPEENRQVVLLRLWFAPHVEGPQPVLAGPVPLGNVPEVLVSEAYQDLAALAAEGPGYQTDWRRLLP